MTDPLTDKGTDRLLADLEKVTPLPVTEAVRNQTGDYLAEVEALEQSHAELLAACNEAASYFCDKFGGRKTVTGNILNRAIALASIKRDRP